MNTRNYVNAALFMTFAVSLAACGQNPNLIADSDEIASTQAQVQAVGTMPPAAPTVAIPGRDGLNGKDGQNGKDACGLKTFTAQYSVRPMKRSELQNLVLPYRSSDKHKIKVLQLGQMTGLANGRTPYVQNSQVLFAVDAVNLPPRAAIKSINLVALKLNVTKIARDPYTRTEMVCILDPKICSGELYTARDWQDNINPKFFNAKGMRADNDFFATQYLDKEVGDYQAGKNKLKIYSGELTLDLSKIMAGARSEESGKALGLLDVLEKRTIKFAVVDDTFVSNDAQLDVTMVEDTCVTQALKK